MVQNHGSGGDRVPLELTTANLDAIAARGVPVPTYDRDSLRPRLAHIGVGGFHRAHLAVYPHELAEDGGDWGIRGLGLLPGDAGMAAALHAQDCLYSLVEKGADEPTTAVIGSIVDYRHTAGRPDATIELLADPTVAIVSMTITEAGYSPDVTTGSTFDRPRPRPRTTPTDRWWRRSRSSAATTCPATATPPAEPCSARLTAVPTGWPPGSSRTAGSRTRWSTASRR